MGEPDDDDDERNGSSIEQQSCCSSIDALHVAGLTVCIYVSIGKVFWQQGQHSRRVVEVFQQLLSTTCGDDDDKRIANVSGTWGMLKIWPQCYSIALRDAGPAPTCNLSRT